MDNLIKNIVDQLLNDQIFIDHIKANLNAIYYDDVINTNDIPYVISIISFVLQNRKVIKIKKDALPNFLKLLIDEIFIKFNLIKEMTPEIENVIDSCIKLLIINIKTKKLFNLCCCN
jgi:hypothetical protein|tara:strand:+ start:1858 stop:2208 length:351 start_codon:yes stop_codon:yes gene_type:complete